MSGEYIFVSFLVVGVLLMLVGVGVAIANTVQEKPKNNDNIFKSPGLILIFVGMALSFLPCVLLPLLAG
jgi:sulfite exporter TauE/SafE